MHKAPGKGQRSPVRRLCCWPLALSVFVCLGALQVTGQQTENQLEQGIRLLASRHFSEAVAAFNHFKQTNPQDARPYFYSGMALAEAGRLTAAALELDEAVRLAPQQLEYLVFQANLFARLKQRTHAEDVLAIVEKQGTAKLEASWVWTLSDVYYRLERFADALGILDLLEQRNPADPRLDLNRGQAYVLRGEFDLARRAFQKSLAKHPGNPITHFELGNLLYQRSDLPAAKSSLLNAVGLEKNNPAYLQKLGAVCLALEETDEAMAYLLRAVALDPANPQTYLSLGQASQRRGEREKSLEFRKKYQEMSIAKRQKEAQTEEIERLLARGERLLDEGKEADARAAFNQIIQTNPNDWAAHGYLAEMFIAAGGWQEAWPHLTKMEALDADSVVGAWLMAKYWHQQGQFEKARAYAEKVRLARPGHAQLRHLLGNIYLGLNQPEKALAEFEAAVKLAPERADFRADLQRLENRKRQNQ